jgi:hypothetical protein
MFDGFQKVRKDLEALIQSSDWVSANIMLGTSPCAWMVGGFCSAYGATAKADACNQGGSSCGLYVDAIECTDDASCKKKPCCKSMARTIKADLESMCTGVSSEKTLKMIDEAVSPCPGL